MKMRDLVMSVFCLLLGISNTFGASVLQVSVPENGVVYYPYQSSANASVTAQAEYNPKPDDEAKGADTLWSLTGSVKIKIQGGVTGGAVTVVPTGATEGLYGGTLKCKVTQHFDGKPDETYTAEKTILINLVKITMITPAGDPVNAPATSGDGQNEFSYSNATPGVLTMGLKASVIPTGCAGLISNRCLFAVGQIGSSTRAWNPNNGGTPNSNGDNLLVTATYTGLPSLNNDFGRKVACIGFDSVVQDESEYEVFFPRNATNHPGGQAGSPNWFYYWSQVVVSLGGAEIRYDASSPHSRFTFGEGNTYIVISSTGANPYNAPYGLHNTLYGIDHFAWVVTHESQHYVDCVNYWGNSVSAWREKIGKGGPDDDYDGDLLPNRVEDTNLDSIFNNGEQFDFTQYLTPGQPSAIDFDFEGSNCFRHKDQTGDHTRDWGSPGMQHGTLDKYDD